MKGLIFLLVATMTGAMIIGICVGKLSSRIDILQQQVELLHTMDDYTTGDMCE